MIKMIATDMDGTFLDENKMFDYEFLSQFYKMEDRNIKFVLASGNQYFRLYGQFIPMSEEIFFVADNGSYIAKGPRLIAYETLSDEQVKAALKALQSQPQLFVIMSGLKGVHLLEKDRVYAPIAHTYYRNLMFHENFDHVDDEIMKIAIYDPNADIHQYEDAIRKLLPSGLTATTAGNEWLDIQKTGVNKGAGIRKLQKLLNISPDECAAFGDAMNDFTLLNSVKYSYAMKNADPRIKTIARETLPWTNQQQGVVKQIRKILNDQY